MLLLHTWKARATPVVLIDDGNLLLLPDTLLCQLAKICVVGTEAAQHQCECYVHILFHFDSFIVLKVANQAPNNLQTGSRLL